MDDDELRQIIIELSQMVFTQNIELQAMRELLTAKGILVSEEIEARIREIRVKLGEDADRGIRDAAMEKLLSERRAQ